MSLQKKDNNDNTEKPMTQTQRKKFLAVYIIGLFSVALVLIMLSYLTQVRANRELNSMGDKLDEQTTTAAGFKARAEQLQIILDDQTKKITDYENKLQKYDEVLAVKEDEEANQVVERVEKQKLAMNYLWMLEKNFQKGDKVTSLQIIEKMEEEIGAELLKVEGILEGNAFIEYISIKEQLNK